MWNLVTLNGSMRVPGNVREGKWSYWPLDEVQRTMGRAGLPNQDLEFVKGKAEEVLRSPRPHLPAAISVLRLDTDWYESTKAELEVLWPRLSPGGWLYVDDYSAFRGARLAVDEWLGKHQGWVAEARKAKAFKTAADKPRRPREDRLGSFSVWKSLPYDDAHPFDFSNATLWSLWTASESSRQSGRIGTGGRRMHRSMSTRY